VMWAIDQGASYITLTGVTGTRMDHTLSNIFLLRSIEQKGVKCRIIDDHNEIFLLSHDSPIGEFIYDADRTQLSEQSKDASHVDEQYAESTRSIYVNGKPGELLSIISVTEEVRGITLKGLEYPLDDATLTFGSSKGISNVFNTETAHISLKYGILLITKSFD
ncbi:MAG: thiamine pyrophosphokinase, partial [Desulfamplus sp.]|nr:thiamine pyrophosphokinase [Desulfamplus sp.]